ncbi:Mannose-specific lectin 1 [Cocos nucifera]|uniref:Mannose-specific lectin 1 n=1 Tax=Cocos nucifera TaxID=13894 RepID=A0A8K0IZE7_COCNU|nr:Mannose-specific lectin 1 [Cocos nucifera]
MGSLPLILSAILVLLTASALAQNNVLLTGQTLSPDHSQISYGGVIFVMQDDCNLVLYNQVGGFTSGTHRRGVNCTLSFTDNGRLIIRRPDGSTVWMTDNSNSPNGKYAAVLRPDGWVAIYGPEVWSAPPSEQKLTSTKVPPSLRRNIPLVENLLFSGQILKDNDKLTAGDYNLDMFNCNLALSKGGYGTIWQTGTSGKGKYCFLRLNHRGKITIKDDDDTTVYASSPYSDEGGYVLVVQANGQAAIYGPVAWSTASDGVKDGEITMVTVE